MEKTMQKMEIQSVPTWEVSVKWGNQKWPHWKIAFQQRWEGREEVSHVDIWGKNGPEEGNALSRHLLGMVRGQCGRSIGSKGKNRRGGGIKEVPGDEGLHGKMRSHLTLRPV